MAWLGTWAKRFEITVDNTNIDSDLTHFPVPIIISATSGQSNDDLTVIFDDLGANDKKIAVTKSDGTTQIYVEVEKWDDTAEEAVLWVSKSDLTLTSASTTTIYIYFDPTESDNTTYVGDVGSRTEVWNSDYFAVHHMSGANQAGCLDSTSNNYDLSSGSGGSFQEDGPFGHAVYFDGSTYFYLDGTDAIVDDDMIIQVMANPDVADDIEWLVNSRPSDGEYWALWKRDGGGGSWRFTKVESGNGYGIASDGAPSGGWEYVVGRYYFDGSTHTSHLYVEGALQTDTTSGGGDVNSSEEFCLGGRAYDPSINSYTGYMAEVRLSNGSAGTVINGAWIKAEYYAMTDNLLEFGTVETSATDYIRSISDSFGITDSISDIGTYKRSISESLGIADLISNSIGKFINIADSIGLTDIISAYKAGTLQALITDSLGITDSISTAISYIINIANNIGITDAISNIRSLIIRISDSLGITDAISTAVGFVVTVFDSLGITDALSKVGTYVRTLSDTEGITDILTTARDIVISIADDLGITDAISNVFKIVVTLVESIDISDIVSNLKKTVVLLVESIGITDAVTKIGTFIRTLSESIDISDTFSRVGMYFREVIDSIDIVDTVSALIKVIIRISDAVGITDAISVVQQAILQVRIKIEGTLKITRTLTENLKQTSVVQESLKIIRTVRKNLRL